LVDHSDAMTGGVRGSDERHVLRVVCHEFRTPIASVRALARELAKGSTRLSVEQRGEAVRLIADHADHLSAMLEAVGAVAEHLPRTSRTAVVDLAGVIAGASAAAGVMRLDVDIAHTVETVAIDVPAVRRILTNLLDNARLHGAEPIRVQAGEHARGLRILVIDSGPGMPAGVAANAFRADPAPVGDAHGLGLWIVAQLVTMLGGRVRVHASDLSGTRIEVVLPLPR
jgi:two-component system OmpR family sensor kinase